MSHALTQAIAQIRRGLVGWFKAVALGWVALGLLVSLSGCVEAQTRLEFPLAEGGAIVQVVHLGRAVTTLGEAAVQRWFDQLAQQATSAGGQVIERGDRALAVRIPFHSGRHLSQQFATFYESFFAFAPESSPRAPAANPDLTELAGPDFLLPVSLRLQQNNLGVVVRNRLSYSLDLRSLALLPLATPPVGDPGPESSAIDWRFGVQAWAVRPQPTQVASATVVPPPETVAGGVSWRLQPGQVNQIDVVFWVPSALGMGAVAIAGLVAAGWIWRSRRDHQAAIAPADLAPAAAPRADP